MSDWKFRRDPAGIREILLSEFDDQIDAAANKIAELARAELGDRFPVGAQSYRTDRYGVSVAITSPAGLGVEAKYGTLTRSAAQAGFRVNKHRD